MSVFVRRFANRKAHRMLTHDVAYCGMKLVLGERLRAATKLARCGKCERAHKMVGHAKATLERAGGM